MRYFRYHGAALALAIALALGFTVSTLQQPAYSQEVSGGLQGSIKDPSGAVVPRAKVVVSGIALMGTKEVLTDQSGYYRFSNLPTGTYSLSVSAEGFRTTKRSGLTIEVGHLPTVNVALEVGAASTTVEVSAEAPVIDVTSTQNMTNISTQALQNLPTGTSFQSVIQFAPMARNEPLAGMSVNGSASGGNGGAPPGSSGNGGTIGYSIGGAADSESSYLVEGQDTENISGGYSKANVPMEFIQEVEMKTSGVSAEFGGALGGVINVIMKKGSNDFHGQLFSSYESSGMDANPTNSFLRYNPLDPGNAALGIDPVTQSYQAQKDHFRNLQPGVTVGGPIVKDRLWFFTGFEPTYVSRAKTVNFGNSSNANNASLGSQYFTRDQQTYYSNLRLDYAATKKIRLFGSWLYQFAREAGDTLPVSDPISAESTYLNPSINTAISAFSHGLTWSAPNATYNVGSDVTLTQNLVSTTKFGYFFENYHDIGWQTTTPDVYWGTTATGDNSTPSQPLPTNLSTIPLGTNTAAYDQNFTQFNANKHWQFNQDFAYYKSSKWGTHNFKFGYQLNRLSNVIDQNGNVPYVSLTIGPGQSHNPFTTTGATNCALLTAKWGGCAGQYGYATVEDFATILTKPVTDQNHAFYVQDAWTVGHGLTLDLGLRIEKESLPAPAGFKVSAINFNWSDKVEPRLGAAWDPTGKGKMKVFGSYGVVNDVMKLLLAQTSWGAQAYEYCFYALGPDGTAAGFSTSDIDPVFKAGRACPNGAASVGANFANGTPKSFSDAATGVSLIENVNERPWEPVAPNVKPYRQHEEVFGFDYQIKAGWAAEVRYDRRRLDHVLEDASLSDTNWGETYTIVNLGEGVNKTIGSYASYLASLGEAFGVPGWTFNSSTFGTCANCPANPKAIRNYDGVEMRLTVNPSPRWAAMLSYTYSSLWGNYAGLTTTDQTDGGTTGRNSPDTTRSFDEPFYYFGANGKTTDGPLPTDRPNVFKGNVYYTLPWWKGRQSTTIGLFQTAYQGSPVSSYIDLTGALTSQPYEATYIYGRGKWVSMSTDAAGNITLGNPAERRTPWFTQSDLNASHTIKVAEGKTLSFEATALNSLNQRAVTAYWGGMDSLNFATALSPGPANLASGAALYSELETGYNPQTWVNGNNGAVSKVIKNSQYGQPYLFQGGRSMRLSVHYTF